MASARGVVCERRGGWDREIVDLRGLEKLGRWTEGAVIEAWMRHVEKSFEKALRKVSCKKGYCLLCSNLVLRSVYRKVYR